MRTAQSNFHQLTEANEPHPSGAYAVRRGAGDRGICLPPLKAIVKIALSYRESRGLLDVPGQNS
jgi:hypothetical protein